jgi:hypothetical protein
MERRTAMVAMKRDQTPPLLALRLIRVLLAIALLTVVPFVSSTDSAEAGASDRGRLVVKVKADTRGQIEGTCVVLRDLTVGMAVGAYCDNDDTDQDKRAGRMFFELPRRSFAIGARAPDREVLQVTPSRFELGASKTVVVRLGPVKS